MDRSAASVGRRWQVGGSCTASAGRRHWRQVGGRRRTVSQGYHGRTVPQGRRLQVDVVGGRSTAGRRPLQGVCRAVSQGGVARRCSWAASQGKAAQGRALQGRANPRSTL